jgi:hypothetical protein
MTRPAAAGDLVEVPKWGVRAVVTCAVHRGSVWIIEWETRPADGSPPALGVAAWRDGQVPHVVPLAPAVAA